MRSTFLLQAMALGVVAGALSIPSAIAETREDFCKAQYRKAYGECMLGEQKKLPPGSSDFSYIGRCEAKHDPGYRLCIAGGTAATTGAAKTTPPANPPARVSPATGPARHAEIGQAAYEAGKYKEAIEHLKRALAALEKLVRTEQDEQLYRRATLYFRRATCRDWIAIVEHGTAAERKRIKPDELERVCKNAEDPNLVVLARRALKKAEPEKPAANARRESPATKTKGAIPAACLETRERRTDIACERAKGTFQGKVVRLEVRLSSDPKLDCPKAANLDYVLPRQAQPAPTLGIDRDWSPYISSCGSGFLKTELRR